MNLERLRREWYRRAGIEDIERDGAGGSLLLHEYGVRSVDARDVAFSGEMADAARAILAHPSLDSRQRAIWQRYCDGRFYSQIVAELRCSFTTVSETIETVKSLMLRPNWEATMRPPKKRPEKDDKGDEFVDLEATIQMGVEVAHRKIVELHGKAALESEDVLDNQRALQTVLAVRSSELEYLKAKQPPYPPATDAQVQGFISSAAERRG
jgi:hypothetical protein